MFKFKQLANGYGWQLHHLFIIIAKLLKLICTINHWCQKKSCVFRRPINSQRTTKLSPPLATHSCFELQVVFHFLYTCPIVWVVARISAWSKPFFKDIVCIKSHKWKRNINWFNKYWLWDGGCWSYNEMDNVESGFCTHASFVLFVFSFIFLKKKISIYIVDGTVFRGRKKISFGI